MDFLARLTEVLAGPPAVEEVGFVVADQPAAPSDALTVAIRTIPSETGPDFCCLAITFWAIPPLYEYALRELKELRKTAGESQCWDGRTVKAALDLSQAVVILNAECRTAWNIRKSILQHQPCHLPVPAELELTTLVLRKHPKSEEAWAHRRWLLHTLPDDVPLDKEFQVCTDAGERYPRNYYAWLHRAFCASGLKARHSTVGLSAELAAIRQWTRRHVSDGSAYHYMQHILNQLADDPEVDHLGDQLSFVATLLLTFRRHESVWHHRRWLAQQLLRRQRWGELAQEWRSAAETQTSCEAALQARDPLTDDAAEVAASSYAVAFRLNIVEAALSLPQPPPMLLPLHGSETPTSAPDQNNTRAHWDWLRSQLRAHLQTHPGPFRCLYWWDAHAADP